MGEERPLCHVFHLFEIYTCKCMIDSRRDDTHGIPSTEVEAEGSRGYDNPQLCSEFKTNLLQMQRVFSVTNSLTHQLE